MKRMLLYLVVLVILILLTMALPNARPEEKVVDSKFIAVSSYLILSSIFDAETTFAAIRNGAHEANPIMKPFIKSGRPATYGVLLASDAAFIYLSYRMKKSSNQDLRKTWWVLPSIAATSHMVAAGCNLRYVW